MSNKPQLRRLAYRPADAAQVCGVSERTFVTWLKSNDNPPPHFRRGGVVLIPRKELEKWLANQASQIKQDNRG